MRPFDNTPTLSLGGATVAYPGLANGLTNEGQLGLGEKRGVYASSAIPYGISGWQVAQLQAFSRLDKQSGIGLDAHYAGIEALQEQRFRLLYGRRLGEKFYLGGNIGLTRIAAQEYGSTSGITAGISLLTQPLPKIWLAASLQNPIQQKLGDYETPTLLRIGATWHASPLLYLLGEVEKDLDRTAQIKGGIEYRPTEVLALRIGARSGSAARIGFGAGLHLKNGLTLDVGSEWHPSLGLTPSAMISWRKL